MSELTTITLTADERRWVYEALLVKRATLPDHKAHSHWLGQELESLAKRLASTREASLWAEMLEGA